MNSKYYTAFASLLTGSFVALSAVSAQAFSFTTNFSSTGSKNDISLNSVTFGGKTISNFSLVSGAEIISNDLHSGGNSGAASSDKGDNASGISVEDPTAADLVESLGNLNLNNIVDTEDQGKFTINLFFESAVNTLFFWERGGTPKDAGNSILGVQAIDASGNLLGNFLELKDWSYAGFSIDTLEINGKQAVGSLGLTMADLGLSDSIAGIQVVSKHDRLSKYNGPDFKVVGARVPEPATMAGIGLVAGLMAVSRRRKSAQDA